MVDFWPVQLWAYLVMVDFAFGTIVDGRNSN